MTTRLAGMLAAQLLVAHPMHTSVTEIAIAADGRSLTVAVRVFADDFTAAAGAEDSAAAAYVGAKLVLVDRTGRKLGLRWERREPVGDAFILWFRSDAPAGLSGARLRNALLCDRFQDQINVVRLTREGRAATLLFTPGAATQTLP